jgi:hypothetical protein
MIQQAIEITKNKILIRAQYFSTKDNSCINKEWLQDILSTHYKDQQIVIEATDGEHIRASGFLGLIAEFSMIFKIPLESILVRTHDTTLTSPFEFEYLPLGLFLGAEKFIPEFEKNLEGAKFVGCAIGRFTPARLRLAYELDQAFPDDNFMIFQGRPQGTEPFAKLFADELEWFSTHQFDQDIQSKSPVGSIGFDDAYRSYPNIWNRYQIEAVIETDPVSDFWFTEKTAKCLATGKPFVLINGFHSLDRLKAMGFFTYSTAIDESYDLEATPSDRIRKVVKSLKKLYTSADKDKRIKKMYEMAEKNIDIYRRYVKSQGHNV